MPKPFPYLFGFFGSLIGLLSLVALLEVLLPGFLIRLDYGFVLGAFYVLFPLACIHALALIFYTLRYVRHPPPPAA